MLQAQERRARWTLIWRVLWFLILIGAPLIAYYYFGSILKELNTVITPLYQTQTNNDIQTILELYGGGVLGTEPRTTE